MNLLLIVESNKTAENSEETVSGKETVLHPMQQLLFKAGLDASHFPNLRITLKVSELMVRMNPYHIAISHKDFGSESFESQIRVARVIESISENKEKEFFVEIEWNFNVESILSDYLHPAFGLIAAEITCPTCRFNFKCQPQIVNFKTIQIACPSCRHTWNISALEDNKEIKVGSLARDLKEKEDLTLQILKQWTNQSSNIRDPRHEFYFPFEFEPPVNDEHPIWIAKSLNSSSETEALLMAFTNQIIFHFLEIPLTEDTKTPVHIQPQIKNSEKVAEPEKKAERKSNTRVNFLLFILAMTSCFAIFQYYMSNKPSDIVPQKTEIIVPHEGFVKPNSLTQEGRVEKELKKISTPELPTQKKLEDSTETSKLRDPESESLRLYRTAQLNFKLKHFPETIKILEQLLEKDKSLTMLYRDLGFAYLMNEEEQKSIKAFKIYLKYFPQSSEKSEIEEFIKSLEDQRNSAEISEPVIGEKWNSLKKRAALRQSE